MGVEVKDVKKLAYADVSLIHYGKNIVFTDFDTPYNYLKEFSKINVSRLRDTNQSDYRNEGHAVKYHSNDYEVVLYDKLADLKQAKISEKRAIEKDNYTQLCLFETYQSKKPFEVLRIEVRLGSKKKIQQVLKKLKYELSELNFNNLFSSKISQMILLATMDEIEEAYQKILKVEEPDLLSLVYSLKVANPKLNYQQLAEILLARQLIDEKGVREFRKVLDIFSPTKWIRLNKRMKQINLPDEKPVYAKFHNKLVENCKISLEDYKDKI